MVHAGRTMLLAVILICLAAAPVRANGGPVRLPPAEPASLMGWLLWMALVALVSFGVAVITTGRGYR